MRVLIMATKDETLYSDWQDGYYKLRVKATKQDNSTQVIYSKVSWIESEKDIKLCKSGFINLLVDLQFKDLVITHLIRINNIDESDFYDVIY